MRYGDRFLQYWRMRIAAPWILMGSRVLDIGCHNGEFLHFLGDRIINSVGIDPLAPEIKTDRYALHGSDFRPPTEFLSDSFDAIVLLATLEHMKDTHGVAIECARIVRPAGRVIITVPGLLVDRIISILLRLRLLDGMSLEEHHGLQPSHIPAAFRDASFSLVVHKRFQIGLNNLFVFEKPGNST